MNPGKPGLQMHRLDRARDRSFWSARVNDDLRLILHRTDTSLLLCYVAHHDAAYAWAEKRKLTVHPATGAAQMVVLQETVQEIVVPRYIEQPVPRTPKPLPMLAAASDAELLSYGVPADWVSTVRQANEDSVLEIAEQLPEEAREAVLSLATDVRSGPAPEAQVQAPAGKDVAAQEVAASRTPMHSDGSAWWRTSMNLRPRSMRHGTSGPSSCIRHREPSSNETSAAPHASQAQPGRERRLSRFTEPCT